MAIQKNFVIKHGLEVDTNLIVADAQTNKVGIGTTVPQYTLHVNGGIGATSLNVSGGSTVNNLVVNGTISVGNTTGSQNQYLVSTGTGVTWRARGDIRKTTAFTATNGQTTFSVNYSIGYVDVYINGVKLTSTEFAANNETTVVLDDACFGDEIVEFVTYEVDYPFTFSGLTIGDENTTVGTGINAINFVGAGVIADIVGSSATVYVSGEYAFNAGIATYAFNAGIATYASNAGIATYASNAGIATYASNAGIATYASNAGIATYAEVSGIATYAEVAGIATVATTAGIATYATTAGIATYATTAGIATYATTAGIATYATTAGIATVADNSNTSDYSTTSGQAVYADTSGKSDYADVAGIATVAVTSNKSDYANVAGISTVAENLTGSPNIEVGIITATGGFVSIAGTTPITIELIGNQLTFNAVGIGSSTLTLF
jgi:hypothetical protein